MQSDIQAIKELFFAKNKELAQTLLKSQNISEADFFLQTGLSELGFSNFKQAERLFSFSLDLSNRQKCPDLSILQGLSFEILYLAGNQMEDLQPLRYISGLEQLDIGSNLIKDLSPLAQFPKLKELNGNYNQIAELQPLENCQNLRKLWLYRNPVSDASPLERNKKLQNLVVSRCLGLEVSSLKGLNVQELHCSYSQGLDFRQFPLMPQLRDLYLTRNGLENMDFLQAYTQLRLLDISINPIKTLRSLSNLSELEYLHCSDCGLESFEHLRGANIKGIFANKNPIRALSALADMPELSVLHLNDSPIADISPLFGLKNLHSFHCNRLTPQQIAQMREKMPHCRLV